MHRNKLLLIVLFIFAVSHGQNAIRGKIIDAATKQPLAFANIIFNNDPAMQTISDIDGKFAYTLQTDLLIISCSYIGYEKKTMKLHSGKNEILVPLIVSVNSVEEITVYPGQNPANSIIKKVIENKTINNPENIASFKYQCYNKTAYDFKSNQPDKRDSILIRNILKGDHLLLMESVTARKFIRPDLSEEIILATKVSGFKNPSFASLSTDLQPFSFYQDDIKLLDRHYLNPISNGSLKKYKFKLEDTFNQGKDTVYVISFKPFVSKNFDGLKGVLYINSNKYAIQNVIAYPAEKGTVNLKIQQQYQLIDNQYWFPEQLNYSLSLDQYPSKSIGMTAESKSYITNVDFNIALRKKEFSSINVRIAEDATKKDSLFWEFSRKEKLTASENKTYLVLDSIGKQNHFDFYLSAFEKLSQSKLPVSVVDIDLSKTIIINQQEGIRLGTGLYTNEKVFKKITIGGFFGYGTKDKKWKYGAEVKYLVSKENELQFGIAYQNNLLETGNSGMKLYNHQLFNFRNIIGSRFDKIIQSTVKAEFKTIRYLKCTVALNQTDFTPLYAYQFENYPTASTYKNTDASVFLRYAYREKIIASFGNTFSSGSAYPILSFYFSEGIKSFLQGQFDYTKIELAAEQSFYTRNFGQTKYRIEAGFIDKSLPLGLLFTGDGSYSKKYPYVTKNTFQTMLPYEFLSDRYANLFLSHDFGGLLFKAGSFQPGISLLHNIGWGNLSNALSHKGVVFKTKENIFLETGLQFDSVLKINYANLGYLGIGAGIFCRYGYYANPEFNDNLAFKLTLAFTVK